MMNINIIGRGNVGSHLFEALRNKSKINFVNPRTLAEFDKNADLSLIAVTDSAIPVIAEKINGFEGIVAHTSGTTPIEIFTPYNFPTGYGVFYPLQTFTKGKKLNYSEIPFLIEGSDSTVENTLINIASEISDNVRLCNSDQRKLLHIAGVFACNFTNHLFTVAEQFLKENSLDFNILRPLIKETLDKIQYISPYDAQTGPAIREDTDIINNHLYILNCNNIKMAEIYRLLSDSIINTYKDLKK